MDEDIEDNDEIDDKNYRTYKIKITNVDNYKEQFQKWFHDYRYAYNKANWIVNESSCTYSKLQLRNLITPKIVNSAIPWFLDTPKDIRAEAVFEYIKNRKAAFTNLKNKNIKYFKLGYMKKRNKKYRYCFGLPGSAIHVIQTNNQYNRKSIKIYNSYTDNYEFHLSEQIPENLLTDKSKLISSHKIQCIGNNYYLLLVFEKPIIVIENRRRLTASDPGIRKFQTTWDIRGKSYTFGYRKSKQIMDLLKKRDKYQGKKNKWGMIQYHKIETKIENLITEMHHHCSTFLCKRYRNIIIPKLDVKNLVKQSFGKMYKKSLLRLSHGKFLQQLKAKAKIYNTNMYSEQEGVHERYSSRQCSSCLYINEKSSDELKKCKKCKLEIDRDINGAKNIYFYNNHLLL
jgi:transposase